MMKINTFKRGFTLIELLVVIAIIGILASVVLASLNSARDKGQTAAIKSSINNARAQAELFYDNNARTYNNLCSDPVLTNIQTSVVNAGGANWTCSATSSAGYRIAAQLVGTTSYYCVDATGKAGTFASAGSGVACP